MNISPKAQRIIDWRESMAVLNDNFFFSIARMYLGEIKTPFNKTDLIEKISAFLRKEDNKKKIIQLLSLQDLKIIMLTKYISSCTRENIVSFIKDENKNEDSIFEHIFNLEERLLIYASKDKKNDCEYIKVNPLLEDELTPLLEKNLLFTSNEIQEENFSNQNTVYEYISPSLFASFISFILTRSDLLKNDGSLKKYAAKEAKEIFSSKAPLMELLTKACINLQLLHQTEKGTFTDWDRLELFAEKSELEQALYISAAGAGHFSRRELQNRTQNLYDTITSIPPYGLTIKDITKLSLFIKHSQTEKELETPSRFSQLLQKHNNSAPLQDSGIMEYMAENAESLGLLQVKGFDQNGNKIYTAGSYFFTNEKKSLSPEKKCLSIDAGFSITVMPGLSLKELLPIILFLDIKHYDTVAVFEINRKSVIRAFDKNISSSKISEMLQNVSMFDLPQNLTVSIDEWQLSYNSASLYKGYVLKVKTEAADLIRKNPQTAKWIEEELAPGVFLFKFESDEDAEMILSKSGLDYIGKVKTSLTKVQPAELPVIDTKKQKEEKKEPAKYYPDNEENQESFLNTLREDLNKIDMTPDQKEGLQSRINRKIVIGPQQLVPDSVRFEKLEASGLDYAGKVHVAENALTSNAYLEIETSEGKIVTGKAKALSKKPGEAEVTVLPEESDEAVTVPVNIIVHIKMVRFRA